MKKQYIGDVGDYGKYGLLHFLKLSGINIGVNWYLTPDDGRADGSHTEYLMDDRMKIYDPDVYNAMKHLAFREDKTIEMVEKISVLHGICFYHEIMDFSRLSWRDRAAEREKWHQRALAALKDVELIFADPDNSLSVTQRPAKKDAQKYILPSEIVDYFNRGQQVMYYHHRSRKNATEWLKEKRQIKLFLPDARLLAVSFRRWSARTYIFVVHEDQYTHYSSVIKKFLDSKWGTILIDGKAAFTTESI